MKCPVCAATFEPTPEEIKNSQPWGVKLCSEKCWIQTHRGVSLAGHRWEYHVGERTPVKEPGKLTGQIDHSKFGKSRGRYEADTAAAAINDLFK